MNKTSEYRLIKAQVLGEQGYTLLELMVVIALFGLMLMFGLPQIQTQFYERELEHAARQFMCHAQFARQRSLYRGRDTLLKPRSTNDEEINWKSGWQVEDSDRENSPEMIAQYFLPANIAIHPKGFVDPHSRQSQIRFNPAGAAKSKHGGFVANRLVFTHTKNTALQRHVILASSGRWRICNPNSSANRKGLGC